MSDLAFPLAWPAGWPRTKFRVHGQFKNGTVNSCRADLRKAVDLLVLGSVEARRFTANGVVISSNMPLRRDGEISGSASEPSDPGVAIYFSRNGKRVCFACDQYNKVWKNLRALEHTLEAMRGIERWGSSSLLERAFTGFAALAAPSGPSMWDVLGIEGADTATEASIVAAWRAKLPGAHPDTGGSTAAFVALTEAKDNAIATVRGRIS